MSYNSSGGAWHKQRQQPARGDDPALSEADKDIKVVNIEENCYLVIISLSLSPPTVVVVVISKNFSC